MSNIESWDDTDMSFFDKNGKKLSSDEPTVREPRCHGRSCKHLLGSKDGKPVCSAFPDGIPDTIAYGNDLHLKPVKGDHGILYERET